MAPYACGAGHCGGLRGEYFQNEDLTGSVLVRVDPRVYFDWGTGGPAAGIDLDTFSVRWTGKITPRFSETYQITVATDDGVRLWIDGAPVVNEWLGRPYTESTAAVSLIANRAHDIVIEYYDQWSWATAHLFWQSPSQPREIVPAWALTPAP